MSRLSAPPLVTGLLIAASLLLAAGPGHAQCGATVSSCRQCHELTGNTPRTGDAWHADHAFADLCASCHGGDPAAADEGPAHLGIVDPLGDRGDRCRGCHADPAAAAAGYLERRGAAPGEGRAAPRQPPPSAQPRPMDIARGSSSPANAALSVMAALIAALGGAFVARDRRLRGVAGTLRPFRLRDVEWSPYVAGALLGLVVAVSMAVFGHRLSGGGAYQDVAGKIGRAVAPRAVFFRHVLPAHADWELFMVGGALLGAFAAARSSGSFRIRTMPDSGWQAVFGPSVPVRWVVAFVGAALTELAAGIAGGCTASLAVSGGAALAPGAFTFIAGMFAGGIPTTWFVYRRRTP